MSDYVALAEAEKTLEDLETEMLERIERMPDSTTAPALDGTIGRLTHIDAYRSNVPARPWRESRPARTALASDVEPPFRMSLDRFHAPAGILAIYHFYDFLAEHQLVDVSSARFRTPASSAHRTNPPPDWGRCGG